MAQLWFHGTALFSVYSCIYNFETTILNIQYSMKCEYWMMNIRVYNWLRPVLSMVSCWVAQEWLERLHCFLNTHVFIILKQQYWIFNIRWNLNIEYWISEYSFRLVVECHRNGLERLPYFLSTHVFMILKIQCWMLNIQYSWKWLCKEGYIELRQLMSNTAWKCKGLMRNETIGVFKLILLQKSNAGYP